MTIEEIVKRGPVVGGNLMTWDNVAAYNVLLKAYIELLEEKDGR